MNNTLRSLVLIGAAAAQSLGMAQTSQTQLDARTARPARNHAQQAKLEAVHVSGSKAFVEADVVAYTGLKIGEMVEPQRFTEAADKLASCGAFDEVQYKYEPARSGSGYSITFTVVDSQQLVPVTFDNFVWFTDAELSDHVRKTVPLFHGTVPTNGEMLQQVTDALQELLAARGIQGTLRFEQLGSEADAQHDVNPTGVLFKVDGVDIKVRNVNFPGATDDDLPQLEEASRSIRQSPYHKLTVQTVAESSIRPIYLERGFLNFKVGDISTQLLNPDPKSPEIAVVIPILPGSRYLISEMRWTGVRGLNAEDLLSLLTLKIGAPANPVQLQSDVNRVKASYGRKGYVRAEVESLASLDDANRTVTYEMKVHEGDVYRFKSIDLDGLDSLTTAKLRETWKLREGEPFDAGYEREYLEVIRPVLAPNISISVDKEFNDEAKTVEITMHFVTHANKVVREKE